MKLNDILVANEALKRLSEKRFSSYAKMRELVKLRKAVEQEVDFYETDKKADTLYAACIATIVIIYSLRQKP